MRTQERTQECFFWIEKKAVSHTQNCLPLPRILTEQLSQVWRLTPSPTARLALGRRLHQRRREREDAHVESILILRRCHALTAGPCMYAGTSRALTNAS